MNLTDLFSWAGDLQREYWIKAGHSSDIPIRHSFCQLCLTYPSSGAPSFIPRKTVIGVKELEWDLVKCFKKLACHSSILQTSLHPSFEGVWCLKFLNIFMTWDYIRMVLCFIQQQRILKSVISQNCRAPALLPILGSVSFMFNLFSVLSLGFLKKAKLYSYIKSSIVF